MDWDSFINAAPERVVSLIEEGPKPLKEYEGELTWADKKRGVMRFKGGDGRGHVNMKQGMAAIAYFDPAFATGEYEIDGQMPQDVQERHAKANVLEEFQDL